MISDRELDAFVDGELGAAETKRIEAAAGADQVLAARLERRRALRRIVSAAHGDALSEAMPERLLAAARAVTSAAGAAEVIDLAQARARRAAARPWPQAALVAASLAAGLIAGLELPLLRAGPLLSSRGGEVVAGGALARALDDQLAANEAGRPIRIGVSFRSRAGRYCRTFRVARGGLAGIACRGPSGWVVPITAATPGERTAAGAYEQAASPLPPPVAETMDAMIAGPPLDAAGEERARARGWR
ncbi:MAG TPA: anti-sigma factor [Caulobacteraceae bacterium]|nr:anti-sigma factor [Caulobacteraceae bacterium]